MKISPEHYDNHIPRTQPYAVDDVMRDLLDICAHRLKLGARLAYLLPTNAEHQARDNPSHPCLSIIGDSVQVLSAGNRRRLITMKKIAEPSCSTPTQAEA